MTAQIHSKYIRHLLVIHYMLGREVLDCYLVLSANNHGFSPRVTTLSHRSGSQQLLLIRGRKRLDVVFVLHNPYHCLVDPPIKEQIIQVDLSVHQTFRQTAAVWLMVPDSELCGKASRVVVLSDWYPGLVSIHITNPSMYSRVLMRGHLSVINYVGDDKEEISHIWYPIYAVCCETVMTVETDGSPSCRFSVIQLLLRYSSIMKKNHVHLRMKTSHENKLITFHLELFLPILPQHLFHFSLY